MQFRWRRINGKLERLLARASALNYPRRLVPMATMQAGDGWVPTVDAGRCGSCELAGGLGELEVMGL